MPLHYLSDGAKSILAIASDIAYRMAVLNPHLLDKVTEETDGIVLIDEIDMHLHPSWQRKVIDSLHKTFPKVQLIFMTHSPTVLTNVPKENIRIFNNGEIYTPDVNTRGREVNSILREIMHTAIRPSDVTEKMNWSIQIYSQSARETVQAIHSNISIVTQRKATSIYTSTRKIPTILSKFPTGVTARYTQGITTISMPI